MSAEFSRDSMDSGTEDEPGGAVDATTGGVEELLPGRCGRSLLDVDMSAELSRDIAAGCSRGSLAAFRASSCLRRSSSSSLLDSRLVAESIERELEGVDLFTCGRSLSALDARAEFSRARDGLGDGEACARPSPPDAFAALAARLSASFLRRSSIFAFCCSNDCDPLLLLAIVRSVAFELLWDDACDALSGLAGRSFAEDDFKAEFSRRSFGSGLIGAWPSCAAGLPPIASETAPAVTSFAARAA